MNNHFKYLDGFRGLAALMVFLGHSSWNGQVYGVNFTGWGKFGVILFFLLSAFLLSNQLLSSHKGNFFGKKYLVNWYLKRFLRIYPLYTLYLVTSVLTSYYLVFILPEGWGQIGLPLNINFKEFYRMLFLLESQSILWSIVVEFKFYIILPLFFYLLSFIKNKKFIIFFIIFLLLLINYNTQYKPEINQIELTVYLPVFLIGILAAIIYEYKDNIRSKKIYLNLVNIFGIIASIFLLLSIPNFVLFFTENINDFNKLILLQSIIGFFLILYLVIFQNTIICNFFDLKILRSIGEISYGFYLIHEPILRVAIWYMDKNIYYGIVTFVITFILSKISYHVFEQYFIKIGRKN